MDLSKDIRSLSDFKRNTAPLLERMEESGQPLVLTVNGKAKLVVQDAASYQKLLDRSTTPRPSAGFAAAWMMCKKAAPSPPAGLAEIRGKHAVPRNSRP